MAEDERNRGRVNLLTLGGFHSLGNSILFTATRRLATFCYRRTTTGGTMRRITE